MVGLRAVIESYKLHAYWLGCWFNVRAAAAMQATVERPNKGLVQLFGCNCKKEAPAADRTCYPAITRSQHRKTGGLLPLDNVRHTRVELNRLAVEFSSIDA